GLVWVADVFIKRGSIIARGSVTAQAAALAKVESLRLQILGRPRIQLPPFVEPGHKHPGFGHLERSVFQIAAKEWKLNPVPKEGRSLHVEVQIAQLVAITSSPAPVTPWPHNEHVGCAR